CIIVQAGWSTIKDTFVWVEPSLDLIGQDLVRKLLHRKDSAEFYQLCYVDSNDQVRGASTPLCFKTPKHRLQPGKLPLGHHNAGTIQSTISKIQRFEREKEELVMEIEQLKEQHETLRSVLKEQQQEIDRLKVCFQVACSSSSSFLKLISDHFSLTTIPEKNERVLIKIQQLKKEQEELRGRVEVQSVEIAQMTPRLKSEQETRRLKDYIQLLQTSWPIHSTSWNLQEARTQLHQEQQASHNTRRRAEKAERELEEVYERMESISMTSAQTKKKSSKLEMQLLELRRITEEKENIAEMAKEENEELSRENQDLRRDIERLRKEFTDLQAAPVSLEHPSPYGSPTDPTPTEEQQLDVLSACLPSGNHYETPDNPNSPEEEVCGLSLQCRHCHEWFPGITQDELELHEDSHSVYPFCTLICDGVEQTIFEDHVFSHEV
uniref:SKICH domain-containing protein n=1 Tax=Salmo trutta TaxID=8032 RepID=A0A673VXH2_SALTR